MAARLAGHRYGVVYPRDRWLARLGVAGAPVLRRTIARHGHIAAELEQALEHELAIEGLVTAEVKGGYEVQIGSTRAFCPGSQIDSRRGGERVPASEYVGRKLQFRVTKIEQGGRNVVVSRRALLEAEAETAAARTWERLRVGAVLSGTVSSVRDFGAFVDLGGVEGMIHVSELSHARVAHPSEVLSVGQTVEVQVIKIADTTYSRGRRQIGLSLKALAADATSFQSSPMAWYRVCRNPTELENGLMSKKLSVKMAGTPKDTYTGA